MAESRSMTTPEVVAKTLVGEHGDFLLDAVAMIAAELMEAEISTEIGAGKGEIADTRSTHRNGYRPRPWATRVGEIELAVPRKRQRKPGRLIPESRLRFFGGRSRSPSKLALARPLGARDRGGDQAGEAN